MTLGERILKYRKKAGISQEELADRLSVTRQSISLWETDQTVPSLDSLITLAEIFGVSLDELCGLDSKEPPQKQEPAAETQNTAEKNEQEQPCFANARTVLTPQLLKDMRKLSQRKGIVSNIVSAIFCLALVLSSIFSDDKLKVYSIIIFGLLFVCNVGLIIRILVTGDVRYKKELQKYNNFEYRYLFYSDYMLVKTKSDTSEALFSVKYAEIKKTIKDSRFVYVIYDNILPIDISSIGDGINIVLGLLKAHEDNSPANKKSTTPYNNHRQITALLTAFFVLSILSIFMALFAVVVAIRLSPIPEYGYTMTEYMWLFWVFIPVPLTSTILGIIYLTKKYKCKKNIIAGVIMCVLLVIYGSFTFAFKDYSNHEYSIVYHIDNEVRVDVSFSRSGHVSYYKQESDNGSNYYQGIIKYDNKDLIAREVIESKYFETTINIIPSDMLPSFEFTVLSHCDYFLLYNTTYYSANNCIYSRECNYILLAYDVDTNLMYFYIFVYPKSF